MKHRKVSSFSFNNSPVIQKPRTLFPVSYDVKTSINVGELTPIDWYEIYPGDTFSITNKYVARLSSAFIRPVMDVMNIEFAAFFVPYRLCYDKFGEVVSGGPASPSAWTQTYSQSVPHIPDSNATNFNIFTNTVGDKLGIAPGVGLTQEINILPYRAFAKIYDDWYRNENVINSMNIQTGERVSSQEYPNNNAWSVNNYMGRLPKVGKRKDYFTSALPSTQKGSAIDLLNYAGGFAPLITNASLHNLKSSATGNYNPAVESNYTGSAIGTSRDFAPLGITLTNGSHTGVWSVSDYPTHTLIEPSNSHNVVATNLGVQVPQFNFNVNDLRYAVALQRILEASARGGNRLTEFISEFFGVQSPDARLQRSEFLGGACIPLSQQAVDQTSATSGTEYLGTQAAYSLSNGNFHWSKAFTEHGCVIICAVIRQNTHNYQQGIPAKWTRTSRFDFYVPQLAFISEQPIWATELYNQAPSDRVFGYKEAWSELRYFPNQVTGNMRSPSAQYTGTGTSPVSYDVMHFADIFANTPTLSKEFIEEDRDNLMRTTQVQADDNPDYLLDVYFEGSMVRVLPARSVPGLIDHL